MDHFAYSERVAREREIRDMIYEHSESAPGPVAVTNVDALIKRVVDLEEWQLKVIEWSNEIADSINHFGAHCKCKEIDHGQE